MINAEPIKIFYCYTPQDEKLRDELEKLLIVLKRLKQSRYASIVKSRLEAIGNMYKIHVFKWLILFFC
jgi:hypothetical protein